MKVSEGPEEQSPRPDEVAESLARVTGGCGWEGGETPTGTAEQ